MCVRACGMDYNDSDAQSEAMCVSARQIQGKIWNKKGMEGILLTKKSLYLKVKQLKNLHVQHDLILI